MKSDYLLITAKGCVSCETEEINTENLAPNEAIVRNEASMISAGTELSRVFEIKRGFSYPVRPGYSAVGRVIKKGAGLVDINVGDRVFHSGAHASVCRISRGERTQGPMIFRLPDQSISPREACLMNLAMVAASGVELAQIELGDTAAVFGLGNIGLLAALFIKKLGARVIGVDTSDGRCAAAREMGLDCTLSCPAAEQPQQIKQLTGGRGADIAVDATGISPAIVNAVYSCAKYGQVLLLGSPRAPFEGDLTGLFSAVHMNMLTVRGAFNSTQPVFETEGSRLSVRRNFDTVCGWIADKSVEVSKLISHIITPKEAQSAYHGLMYKPDEYRCVVIDWS